MSGLDRNKYFNKNTFSVLKKNIKKLLFYQYIHYPILFLIIGYVVIKFYPNNYFLELAMSSATYLNENLLDDIGIFHEMFAIYFIIYVVGFFYGTISIVIRARSFKSIILTPLIAFMKFMVTGFMIPFLTYLFIFETALLLLVGLIGIIPFSIIMIKKMHRKLSKPKLDTDGNIYITNDQ